MSNKKIKLALTSEEVSRIVTLDVVKLDLSNCPHVDDAFIADISRMPQFARICFIDLRGTKVTSLSLSYILIGVFGTRRLYPYISKKYNKYEALVTVYIDNSDDKQRIYEVAVTDIVGIDVRGNELNIDYSNGVKVLCLM